MSVSSVTEREVIDLSDHEFDVPCQYPKHGEYGEDASPARWWVRVRKFHSCLKSPGGLVCDPCKTYIMTTERGVRCHCGAERVEPYRDAVESVVPINPKGTP